MDKLKELYESHLGGQALTKQDKDYIREQAAIYGLEVNPTRCKSFWLDTMVVVMAEISKSDTEAENENKTATSDNAIPVLRRPFRSGMRWNLRYIDQAMMTKELHQEMVRAGLGGLFERQ